ncbi:MAG: ABC transporter substrate-binding protein [Candidatus Thermoplasmatota archaeon]|nr:ABC transporter substrate-binding protein [Candidatus Thermoplasmatota archaeon]
MSIKNGMKGSTKMIAMIVVIVVIVSAIGAIEYEHISGSGKGRIITVDSNVSGVHLNRIISLDPAASATLYAIGAFKDVLGKGPYTTYPKSNLPNMTCYPDMSVEQIVNLSPDAVISFSSYPPSEVQELLNASIDYIFLSAGINSTFSQIMQQNILLGELTGNQNNATLLNNWMKESLNQFSNVSVVNKTLLYAMCVENGATWTTGKGTFVNAMFNYSHLNNIANGSGFYEISNENIVNSNPQVILLGTCFNQSDLDREPFDSTSAYKNNTIYTAFDTNLFSEPNFRNIFAIEWLIYNVYHVTVKLPEFPFNLQYNPEPTQVQSIYEDVNV